MEENIIGDAKPKRKMKFMPKAPVRRQQKLVLPKSEKVEEVEVDDVKAQELMKRFTEASNRPKFKPEIKASKTKVSSFSFGPSVPNSGGGGNDASSSVRSKEYKEPWDYYKYYPVTLPVRRPYSGNPELLDEQEFKEDLETNAYKESSVKTAQELGLLEEDLEKKLIFIQLPPTLPLLMQSTKENTASSSKSSKDVVITSKACSLNELPACLMGKMLVYKSGAIKLKLGDHLYNVSGGLDCNFSQDVVAINTEEKTCCNIGELNKRAIITPDIDSILDNMEL